MLVKYSNLEKLKNSVAHASFLTIQQLTISKKKNFLHYITSIGRYIQKYTKITNLLKMLHPVYITYCYSTQLTFFLYPKIN